MSPHAKNYETVSTFVIKSCRENCGRFFRYVFSIGMILSSACLSAHLFVTKCFVAITVGKAG